VSDPSAAPAEDGGVVPATDDLNDDEPAHTELVVEEHEDHRADPLAVAEIERDGYLDDLRRVSAEFANFRKQVDRRNTDMRANAAADLVQKLLPVLDACDAALMQGVTDVKPIRASLLDTLGKEGLEIDDPNAEPFDPERHEAVMTEEGEGEPVITEVLRTGYAWHGRIIRPAMVKVRG